MIEYLSQIDTNLFVYLNGLHNDFWDSFFLWVTEKYSWLFLYILILLLLAWRYLSVRFLKGEGITGFRISFDKGNWPWLLLALLFIVFLITLSDQVSVHLFKNVFQRLRPSHEPGLADIIHLPRTKGGVYGFVSSHAANSFAIAYFTSRIIGLKWYTRVIFIWALGFSYSRIYIGVHYPGDSIGGALLGIFLGWLLVRSWGSAGRRWFPSLLPGSLR